MGEEIELRFAATCSCGTLLRVGDTAFLDATARRQVWCVDHVPAADDPRWRELALATACGGQLCRSPHRGSSRQPAGE
jgi:hypothetical protein